MKNPLNGKLKGSCILTTWRTHSATFEGLHNSKGKRIPEIGACGFDPPIDTGVAFFPGVRYRVTVEVIGYDPSNTTSADTLIEQCWSMTYPNVIKKAKQILRSKKERAAHDFAQGQLQKAKRVLKWLKNTEKMRKYIDTLSLKEPA